MFPLSLTRSFCLESLPPLRNAKCKNCFSISFLFCSTQVETLAYNFSYYFLCEKFVERKKNESQSQELGQGLKGAWLRRAGGAWSSSSSWRKAANCKAKEAETESIQRRQTPTNSMEAKAERAKRNRRVDIAFFGIPCKGHGVHKGVVCLYCSRWDAEKYIVFFWDFYQRWYNKL